MNDLSRDPFAEFEAAARDGEAAARTVLADRPDGLPDGFRLRADGVWREVEVDGEKESRWLCSPLTVLSLTRDRMGTGWGALVEVMDGDGGAHRWAIPAGLIQGDGKELRAGLARYGWHMASDLGAAAALSRLLRMWRPSVRCETSARLGWTDTRCAAFVLGTGRALGAGSVLYQPDDEHAHVATTAAAEMIAEGTPEGWREGVAALCVGNPILLASVSLAFSGPLLEPMNLDGFGLHLRGESSKGKSTALHVAASVWGSPRFVQSWRATANGLEGVASACNSTVLILDEMGEVSGREVGMAAYMLANGVGKTRGGKAGGTRPVARWRTPFLSSGEVTLATKMAEAGERKRAGQDVRLLDVAADTRAHGAFDVLHGSRDGGAFSERTKAATAGNHGRAGPAFVEAFLGAPEETLARARYLRDAFRKEAAERFDLGGDGQEQRAAGALGLVAAAGELATHWGLTGWRVGAAREAALEVLGLWLEGRGGVGPAEAREAVARCRDFLTRHGPARFELVEPGVAAAPVRDRAGWRDQQFFYVSDGAWAEMHAGNDAARAARHVADARFLELEKPTRLKRRAPRGVPGRPRLYTVKAGILGDEED